MCVKPWITKLAEYIYNMIISVMLLAPDNLVHNTFAPFTIYVTYQYDLLTVMRTDETILDLATCPNEQCKTIILKIKIKISD